ncbi:hypothetical protein P8452_41966 [Trifolium repens]|nr:hypothetical protein P8452_41966 [Trifolium repens]
MKITNPKTNNNNTKLKLNNLTNLNMYDLKEKLKQNKSHRVLLLIDLSHDLVGRRSLSPLVLSSFVYTF